MRKDSANGKGFSSTWVGFLTGAAIACVLLLTLPSLSAASEPVCMIEPWFCEIETEPGPSPSPEFGRYIVVFHEWVEDPAAVAREQVEKYGGRLGFVYKYALKGYSAEYPIDVIDEVESEPSVKYVQVDHEVGKCFEPWECEEESKPEPRPEPEPEPIDPDELLDDLEYASPGSDSADTGSAGLASVDLAPNPPKLKRCGKGEVRRHGRCLRKHAGRRACRKPNGRTRRQCIGLSAAKPAPLGAAGRERLG